MPNEAAILTDLLPRPWTPEARHGFHSAGLFVGPGSNGIEVAVARAAQPPSRTILLDCWKSRRGARAAPVLLVVMYPDGAALCGASGEEPPVYPRANAGQVERLCREVLAQPDRHAALRFLGQAMPSLETALPGLNNEGLVALHELQFGALERPDWADAGRKAQRVLGRRNGDLLTALGYRVERLDNLTSLLRSGDRRTALAVMLIENEAPESGTARFNNLSPVNYALTKADAENLPWVILVQGNRLRLYSTAVDAGVGRRGRTETYIECQPSLLSDEHLPYLWLLYSAEALATDGSLKQILDDSERFSGDLAERLRERIYVQVIPTLAKGIASARNIERPSPEDLEQTYEMALTVLFRLLFIAYAEDRDLLPYRFNDAYKRRSLKQKAQELADCVVGGVPIAEGNSHWQEVALLWQAVAIGNREWGVPAYNGGLFTDDAAVSPAGAELANITVSNQAFEAALRALLVIETPEDVLGPVDFRSLGVREFGTIYEGLLESELALAETDLALRRQKDKQVYFPAMEDEVPVIAAGDVYLHNRSGARKSSGSYYTKHFAVEHLLDGALEPALSEHFERLEALGDADAAETFFDFRVADVAMGSGHFLIAAIDRIEKRMADFLTRRDLPGVRRELSALREAAVQELGELMEYTTIEDGQLLRRLIARRCIYGVDLNALSVQLARLAVWIHTFVPGLPLSVLDHSLVRGNALIGVGTVDDIRAKFQEATGTLFAVDAESLLGKAARPLSRLANINDATLQDIAAAREAIQEARAAIGETEALCDLIAAGPITEDRKVTEFPFEEWERRADDLETSGAVRSAREDLNGLHALHFPIAFPEVFLRSRAGFDVILGNPPWEKVRTEEHEFWARHFPGLRGLGTAERERTIADARVDRPELEALLSSECQQTQKLRDALRALPGMNTGHPDLFRAFVAKYIDLLATSGGRLGVVLPAETFKIKGTSKLRGKIFDAFDKLEIQFLLNRRGWVFDEVHYQKTIALLVSEKGSAANTEVRLRPNASSLHQWQDTLNGNNVIYRDKEWLNEYSNLLVVPSVAGTDDIEIIDKFLNCPRMSNHPQFQVRRIYADFETTRDRARYVLEPTSSCWPVYKGESFDLWKPDTGSYFAWAEGPEITAAAQQRRMRARRGSAYLELGSEWLRDPNSLPILYSRIAFRRTTNRTNTRTLIASLVPPKVVTTEDAPWILWLDPHHDQRLEAILLGFLASVIVDWWARRFVEGKVEEEVFKSLRIPTIEPTAEMPLRIAALAGRLACPDERFADWAEAVDVEYGPVPQDEKDDMIFELDAVVAHLYGLSEQQLVHVFKTFHEGWDYQDRLDAVLRHYNAWRGRC